MRCETFRLCGAAIGRSREARFPITPCGGSHSLRSWRKPAPTRAKRCPAILITPLRVPFGTVPSRGLRAPTSKPMTDDQQPKSRGGYLPQHRRLQNQNQKPPLQLQERDLRMMRAVFESRFLTRSLLGELFPPDPTRTPRPAVTGSATGTNLDRRLAKLFHHGYLDRVRTVRRGELIYALGTRGAELLRTQQPELPLSETTDWSEKNRALSEQYIEHGLMVARLRAALTIGAVRTPSTVVQRFEREGKALKAEWRHQGQRWFVNPDGFFILRDSAQPEGKQRRAFFVEADRSTMTLERLELKFQSYARLYADRQHQEHFGIPSFRVLTVTKSRERASNLLKLVAGAAEWPLAEHRQLFYFTTEEAYRDVLPNVLAAIWRCADAPENRTSIVWSPLARV